VSLFEGIISDLFPGVELPQPDYGVFLDAIKACIAKRHLQPVPWFIEKIIQVVALSDFRPLYPSPHNLLFHYFARIEWLRTANCEVL